MGQAPSAPDTNKTFHAGENKRCAYVVANMQGWRDSMEDAHTTLLAMDEKDENAFFGVYDGHADEGAISGFASDNVWAKLKEHEAYKRKQYQRAFEAAFVDTDAAIRERNLGVDAGGATAIAMLYTTDEEIYVANAGDSRCVLSTKGLAKPLSVDHKPDLEAEKARIVGAGGFVTEDNRVNGLLAPARAMGDFFYKQRRDLEPEKQIVTAFPEVKTHTVTAEDEFVVVACDGIWDVLSSQQVIDSIRRQIADGASLQECADRLLDACLSPQYGGIGCDNMTLIIVALLHGRPVDAWRAEIKERVAAQDGYPTPEDLPSFFEPDMQREARTHWENVRQQERNGTGSGGTGGIGPLRTVQLASALGSGKEGMFT